ncbi:hypothetical protein TNCV_1840951 [Trichonephila clavipes]|nr:hypothetical protein TNCV_1840951 [Trichonephila clavipes]
MKESKVGPILFGYRVEIERFSELHCRRLLLTSRRRVTKGMKRREKKVSSPLPSGEWTPFSLKRISRLQQVEGLEHRSVRITTFYRLPPSFPLKPCFVTLGPAQILRFREVGIFNLSNERESQK